MSDLAGALPDVEPHGVMLRISEALFLAVKSYSHHTISRTVGMPFDFSSDLDVGRRPELKSDEKSKRASQ